MTSLPRVTVRALAALAAVGLALAPTAALAADGSIAHVETKPGSVQLLVSVPADAEVDLDGVTVTVDGKKASATAETAGTRHHGAPYGRAGHRHQQVDGGQPVRGRQGRRQGVHHLGPRQTSRSASSRSPARSPRRSLRRTDRDAASALLDGLDADEEDPALRRRDPGRRRSRHEGQRSLLVLSDGADTSDTPIEARPRSDHRTPRSWSTWSRSSRSGNIEALQQLATAGKGQVISSDPAALQAAFAAEADVLARQVLVTATLPSGFDKTEATIKVTLPTSTGSVTAEAFSAVEPGSHASSSRSRSWTPPSWALYAGPAALALGLVFFVVLLVPRKQARLSAADRVTRYTEIQAAGGSTAEGGPLFDADVTFASAKETAANVLRRNKDLDARISSRLQGAGSELKSSEWLLVHGGLFFLSGLTGLLLGGGNLLIGFAFIMAGLFGPWMYLGFRRSRRRKAFNSGLPDTLQLMSGSLAAGLSLAQSIDTIVREGAEPIASEFRRVLVETRLGVSLEDAMEGVAERFDSKDFEWVVMAIKIQRQVGGNLAELLDTVAATMREREYVRRQVAALAAEGKLSAWVLGGLPPLFMVYLLLTNYDYVIVMFQEPLGWAMLAGAATILGIGVFWMSRLVKVEV